MRFVLQPRKELFLGIRIIGISLEESESELLLPTPRSLGLGIGYVGYNSYLVLFDRFSFAGITAASYIILSKLLV